MFVILAYDVNESRVEKINSICSRYLFWRQNSVFTGIIDKCSLDFLEEELKREINLYEDYILIFIFPSNVKFKLKEIGIKRYDDSKVF
jgi:CRISPR-associated endonuclease Cas2